MDMQEVVLMRLPSECGVEARGVGEAKRPSGGKDSDIELLGAARKIARYDTIGPW